MKKVTAFIGSARKKATYDALNEFEKILKQYEDIDFEYVFLNEYNLNFCLGCCQCFDKGECCCPHKDDRDILIEKMENSDGVIFASPSYAYQVSGRFKNFFDRLAFIFHRPRFFGKTFTAILTQGVPIGKDILKYMENTAKNLGFNVVKGCSLWTMQPIDEKRQKANSKKIEKCAERFYKDLQREKMPAPSLLSLMLFRTTRSGLKYSNKKFYDYHYFEEKGWFESDYYYDVSLNPIKKLMGRFFDYLGRKIGGNL